MIILWEEHGKAALTPRTPQLKVCRVIQNDDYSPLVCSHRGYHKAWSAPVGTVLYPPGTGVAIDQSVSWLVKRMAIVCFDLDLSPEKGMTAIPPLSSLI